MTEKSKGSKNTPKPTFPASIVVYCGCPLRNYLNSSRATSYHVKQKEHKYRTDNSFISLLKLDFEIVMAF